MTEHSNLKNDLVKIYFRRERNDTQWYYKYRKKKQEINIGAQFSVIILVTYKLNLTFDVVDI